MRTGASPNKECSVDLVSLYEPPLPFVNRQEDGFPRKFSARLPSLRCRGSLVATATPYRGGGGQLGADGMSHKYDEILVRLGQIEGHIRGIKDMVHAGKPPADLLHQLAAVQAAERKVAQMIVEDHLLHIAEAIDAANAAELMASLNEALKTYMR